MASRALSDRFKRDHGINPSALVIGSDAMPGVCVPNYSRFGLTVQGYRFGAFLAFDLNAIYVLVHFFTSTHLAPQFGHPGLI